MINRWDRGRAEVDGLLADGHLQKVKPDRNLADLAIGQAKRHLDASHHTLEVDPVGSFQLAYEASRKAFAAVLENEGLRATSKGGHRAIEDALRAQLVPPLGKQISNFGWMRSLRNASAYPSFERPTADADDARKAQLMADELIALAEKLLDQMPVY